jgi:hypothetical protein
VPRRSTPQRQKDDAAFPVRVKVIVPPGGFGRLHVAMLEWLDRGPGQGDYACHGAEITGAGYDATAFYFRDVETAQAFVSAFPNIVLADGTDLSTYSSPERVRWRPPLGSPRLGSGVPNTRGSQWRGSAGPDNISAFAIACNARQPTAVSRC